MPDPDAAATPPRVRILARPKKADAAAVRGVIRLPQAAQGAGKGGGGRGGGARFWEAARHEAAQWTAAERAHFDAVRAHVREKLPKALGWMLAGGEIAPAAGALLTECLELCSYDHPRRTPPADECLAKWLFACSVDADKKPSEDTALLDANNRFHQLRRKVDALRIECAPAPPARRHSSPTPAHATLQQQVPQQPQPQPQPAPARKPLRTINPKHFGSFVCPKEVDAVDIPNAFPSVQAWVACVSTNILAEYWALVTACHKPKGGGYKTWLIAEGEVLNATTVAVPEAAVEAAAELSHQLFRFTDDVDGVLRVVTHVARGRRDPNAAQPQPQPQPAAKAVHVAFYPPLSRTHTKRRKKCAFIAYIGSHLMEYSAVREFDEVKWDGEAGGFSGWPDAQADGLGPPPPRGCGELLRSILNPKERFAADGWGAAAAAAGAAASGLNASQQAALQGLRHRLEVIHGPPGTGKSFTIAHLIQHQLPPAERVLVTCTRNGAVDALAAKLHARVPVVVFGAPGTIGDAASGWTVAEQLRRDDAYRGCTAIVASMAGCVDALRGALGAHAARLKSPGRFALLRHCRALRSPLWRVVLALHDYTQLRLPDASARLAAVRRRLVREIWAKSRVFLCTISTSVRMYTDFAQCHEATESLVVDTVIVDECGCTSETATAVLLKINPKRLLLVGDHKQLPAFSLVSGTATNHAQSLMARAVRTAPATSHMLTEQYRMQRDVCRLVGSLFYSGKLQTAAGKAVQPAAAKAAEAITWIATTTPEEKTDSHSFTNGGEAEAVVAYLKEIRRAADGEMPGVGVIAFYRAQCALLTEQLKGMDRVEVATADAVQGREFDVVVLSCVRSNAERDMGFLRDLPRLCVALSRARRSLVIFGDPHTLSANQNWRQVHAYATCAARQRPGFALNPAVGDTRQLAREADVVPDEIVPKGRSGKARSPRSKDREKDRARDDPLDDCDSVLIYMDPEAAAHGVFVPAAWHQTDALRQQQEALPAGGGAAGHTVPAPQYAAPAPDVGQGRWDAAGGWHPPPHMHPHVQHQPPQQHVQTWGGYGGDAAAARLSSRPPREHHHHHHHHHHQHHQHHFHAHHQYPQPHAAYGYAQPPYLPQAGHIPFGLGAPEAAAYASYYDPRWQQGDGGAWQPPQPPGQQRGRRHR